MPTDLNIVVLKLTDTDKTNAANRYAYQLQFTREFTVRKDIVLAWLRFLKANYYSYRDVSIDYQVDLPDNTNVIDQVANSLYRGSASREKTGNQRPRTQLDANPANSTKEEEAIAKDNRFDSSAILAMNANRGIEDNLDALRRQVSTNARPLGSQQPQQRPALTQPNVEERLLTEQLETQPILLLAFPSLYLRGLAKINQLRDRYVSYYEHTVHLLKYKDGRFARHPRQRYVVFNTEMRIQTKNSSRFFLKLNPRYQTTTLEDIRAAFKAPDNLEARRLLNTIIRSTSALRGIPVYYTRIKKNLELYCRFLGIPDFFFTFSVADL